MLNGFLLASISRWMRRMFVFLIALACGSRKQDRVEGGGYRRRIASAAVVVASCSNPDAWRQSCFTG